MRGLQIKNSIVDNVAIFDELPEGWIIAPVGVGVGWVDNGDGSFSAPIEDDQTIEQNDSVYNRLVAIDAQTTPRRIREAMLSGDMSYIQALEDEAETLRASLI